MNLPQNILDLIHKLVNITVANGSNPNEEAFAAKALQRLLAEHQLTMADIPNKRVGENVVQRNYTTGYKKKLPQAYSIYAATIASAWRCRVVKDRAHLIFVGFETDATLAEFFFNSTWKRVRLKGYKEAKTLGYSGRGASKYAEDFAIGAAISVRDRMKSFDPTDTGTSALVSLKDEQVGDYMREELGIRGKGSRLRRDFDNGALMSGKAYGNSMDIHTGIQGSNRSSALAIGA